MDRQIQIAMILGSIRDNRFCDTVARWAAGEIEGYQDFNLTVIDPAGFRIPNFHTAQADRSLDELKQALGQADGFVVVTPEYNHSFGAGLKALIDSAYSEWQAKPVGFVSYGGVSGGLRAVEQLRQVFAELHAMTVRDSVSFASAWDQFDAEGQLRNPEQARRTMARMLTQLSWWARALKAARQTEAYGQTG